MAIALRYRLTAERAESEDASHVGDSWPEYSVATAADSSGDGPHAGRLGYRAGAMHGRRRPSRAVGEYHCLVSMRPRSVDRSGACVHAARAAGLRGKRRRRSRGPCRRRHLVQASGRVIARPSTSLPAASSAGSRPLCREARAVGARPRPCTPCRRQCCTGAEPDRVPLPSPRGDDGGCRGGASGRRRL